MLSGEKMNLIHLKKLIKLDESEFLDFKEQHQTHTIDLLHDILCLSNSFHEGDRYLVYGVTDNKQIVGLENHRLRRNQANINNFLQTSFLNRLPIIQLKTYSVSNHKLDILIIKNRPDKPFFLTRDFSGNNKVIRAGVIYSRVGDTNTPLSSSAREDQLELMWRERFGLGVPPLERVLRYLEDVNNWIKVEGDEYIYHRLFPEFTINFIERDENLFQERWATQFPDKQAYRTQVEVLYLGTRLLKMSFVICDGGRFKIPLPEIRVIGKGKRREFYLTRDSHKYKIAKIFRQYDDLERTLIRIGIKIYEKKEDVPPKHKRTR